MKMERRFTKATVTRKGVIVYKDQSPAGIPHWECTVVHWKSLTSEELQDIVYHAANAVAVALARESREADQELF